MARMLCFSRNRCMGVEPAAANRLRVFCRVNDNLMEAETAISVSLPDLEILDVTCRVTRPAAFNDQAAQEVLKKVKGVRVGSGMLKIIKGVVGDDPALAELRYMVEECCHGVILHLTKPELAKAPVSPEESGEFFREMVRKNIRLYNRCTAFGANSSLMQGIEPPKGG